MKVRFPFKTPDVIEATIEAYDLDDDQAEKVERLAVKFISYGEDVVLELDTETGEMSVVKRS